MPPEVFPTQGGGPGLSSLQDQMSLWCPVSGPPTAEAQPAENLRSLFPPEDAAAKSTEAILRAFA